MLTRDLIRAGEASSETNCDYCGGNAAEITMRGYGDDESGDCNWCGDCAMQLARKILEDFCELRVKGGRHV
jgi:hypothetical protein